MNDAVADALLPPAIVAVLALALLVAGRRRAAAFALAALVLFAIEAVPHVLITPLLSPPPAPPGGAAPAAIVVLASGVPELLDTSRTPPSIETLKRLRAAAALSRATGKPILVSGAGVSDDAIPIATQMALSLEADFGVRATWAETASANLWQSAVASAAILRGAGIAEIYLVAEPWELRLSVSVFRAAGLIVTPAPLPGGERRALDLSALAVITPAWLDSALALREWTGLACQAVSYCAAWMRTQAVR